MNETIIEDSHNDIDYKEILIKYRESNYDVNFIKNLDENIQIEFEQFILNFANSFRIEYKKSNIDTICKLIIAFINAIGAQENNQYFLTKEKQVFNLLCSKILLNAILRYVVKHNYYNILDFIEASSEHEINFDDNKVCKIERLLNIQYLLQIFMPYIYNKNEITSFINNFRNIQNPNEKLKFFNNFVVSANKKFKNEYKNKREFEAEFEKKIKNANFLRFLSPVAYRLIKKINFDLEFIRFIILEFNEEYTLWKADKFTYPANCPAFIYMFGIYYLALDNNLLYYFFGAINEPLAFDKNQIEYILEMAPKLRIASYLNKEYSNYKKLYNPDARDFDFGKDEAEEEIAIEEQSIVKNNYEGKETDDDQDTKKEADKRTHLPQLPHFKDDKKLLKLLQRFRKNDLNYIHKHTREEDWLFVFGLKGDTPPEGFEKVKWQGKNKKKPPTISPKKFINFLEILGYDLDELYNDVGLLNRCFIANEGNKEIHKKDFDCREGKYGHVADYKELKKIVSEIGLCP